MIRQATAADTPRLVEMATRFLESTPYGLQFLADPACLELLIGVVLEHGVILVCETTAFKWEGNGAGRELRGSNQLVGMIALTALPHVLTGEPYGDEQVWWVEPEHRGGTIGPRLLRAAEDWARENHLTMLKMVAPEGSDVSRFYLRLGYTAVETAFVKVF